MEEDILQGIEILNDLEIILHPEALESRNRPFPGHCHVIGRVEIEMIDNEISRDLSLGLIGLIGLGLGLVIRVRVNRVSTVAKSP